MVGHAPWDGLVVVGGDRENRPVGAADPSWDGLVVVEGGRENRPMGATAGRHHRAGHTQHTQTLCTRRPANTPPAHNL